MEPCPLERGDEPSAKVPSELSAHRQTSCRRGRGSSSILEERPHRVVQAGPCPGNQLSVEVLGRQLQRQPSRRHNLLQVQTWIWCERQRVLRSGCAIMCVRKLHREVYRKQVRDSTARQFECMYWAHSREPLQRPRYADAHQQHVHVRRLLRRLHGCELPDRAGQPLPR